MTYHLKFKSVKFVFFSIASKVKKTDTEGDQMGGELEIGSGGRVRLLLLTYLNIRGGVPKKSGPYAKLLFKEAPKKRRTGCLCVNPLKSHYTLLYPLQPIPCLCLHIAARDIQSSQSITSVYSHSYWLAIFCKTVSNREVA